MNCPDNQLDSNLTLRLIPLIPQLFCGGEEHWWEADEEGQDDDDHQTDYC